jgi:hypothetical protein
MKNSVIPKIDDKYLWWPGKDEGEPAPPIVWFNESDEETMTKDQQIKALKKGNTMLISALMDMVNQFFQTNEDTGTLTHSFMFSEEHAISVLIEAGFATEDEGCFYLDYKKLDYRQEEEKGG